MDNKNIDRNTKEGINVLILAYQIKKYIEKLGDTKLSRSREEALCDVIENGVNCLIERYESARAASDSDMKKIVRNALKSIAESMFSYFINTNQNNGRLLDLYDDIYSIL